MFPYRRCAFTWVLLVLSPLFVISLAPGALFAGKAVSKLGPGGGPHATIVLDGSPVHNVGNLRVHASNWGAIGSRPGSGMPFSSAPSAEWPGGSGVEYLFEGGLWVGALVGGIPAVSTAAFEYEFRPSADPRDVVYRSALGAAGGNRIPFPADDDGDGTLDEDWLDGYDNDTDGLVDEDFAGTSNQMFVRRFRDDDPSATQIYPQHTPLHLLVREESYQWSDADYDDFVGFTFWITNDGAETLHDVYVGVLADGDVGHRSTPDYWEDDRASFVTVSVDHAPRGIRSYDFPFWYDLDGDGGQASAYCGIVILDHPTDPSGSTAPAEVGAATVMNMITSLPYPSGGLPTNDFERYEAMSNEIVDAPALGDVATLVAVGPFAQLAAGETIEFSFALVATPRDDFTNVDRAAVAYHGQWFDLDNDPSTGIDGKEHQEHWYLPSDNPTPVAITSFGACAEDGAVRLGWNVWADEDVAGFSLYRAAGSGVMLPLAEALAGDRREYVDDTVEPGMSYEYLLVAHGASGWTAVSPQVNVRVPGIALALRQNAPNPFHASTTIVFEVPERGDVNLAVFDTAGRRVATLVSGERTAGAHEAAWDGTDANGRRVSAGVYFCRLEAGKRAITRKVVLLR